MLLTMVHATPPARWDQFVLSCPDWDFAQTTDYGQLRSGDHAETAWVVIQDELAQWQGCGLFVRDPHTWTLWKGPCGPRPSAEILAALLLGAPRDLPVRLVLSEEWEFEDALTAASFGRVAPFATALVATNGGSDGLLSRMTPEARSRVRRATRAGISVVQDPALLGDFWPVYAKVMQREESPDFATHDHLQRLLESRRSHFFAALEGTEIVAGSICYRHCASIESRYVATGDQGRRVGALNLVHHDAAIWAESQGLAYLDLGGIALEPATDKLVRINRFKFSYGGKIKIFPIYSGQSVKETQ